MRVWLPTLILLAFAGWIVAVLVSTKKEAAARARAKPTRRAAAPSKTARAPSPSTPAAAAPTPGADKASAPAAPTVDLGAQPMLVDLALLSSPPAETRCRVLADYPAKTITRVQEEVDRTTAKLGPRMRITRGLATSWREPKELAAIVSGDPVLAGRVLRTINSGYYGLKQRVGSISHAVLLLGTNEVRNIVLNASLAGSFALGNVPPSLSHALWKHAFASSRAAYVIAKRYGFPRPDEVATAALMHDIGKLLLLSLVPAKAVGVFTGVRFSHHALLDREEVAFGVNHAVVGALMGTAFGLPERECAAIGAHHVPAYEPPKGLDEESRTIAVLYAVNLLGHYLDRDEDNPDEIYRPQPGWLDLIGPGVTLDALADEPTRRALQSAWHLAA